MKPRRTAPRRAAIGTSLVAFGLVVVIVAGAVGYAFLARQSRGGLATSSQVPSTATLLYSTMPKEFSVDGYTFYMEYNGTGYTVSQNGTATANHGFTLLFAVSDGTSNQTVVFGWVPPAPAPQALPAPHEGVLFDGRVLLSWHANSTGTYMQVQTSAPSSQVQSTAVSHCMTTNNSIGCVTVSGTVTIGSSCSILPLGKGLFIHVVTDNGEPLNNTQIQIYFASPICPGIQISTTEQILRTNSSGWANYDLNGAGTYKITVQYTPQQYNFSVLEKVNQTTYATARLPSGNLSVMYVLQQGQT